jgi:KDO2-lipid IV(A) lauroyltransferase
MLHPRYWGMWLSLGILWLLVLLPYPLLVWLGKGLGRLLAALGGKRRHITATNLALCFPDKPPAWRENILQQSFESAAMAVFEMGMAWWWPEWRLKKYIQVEGLEHVQQLERQGAVLLGMHFTTLDMGGAGLSLYQSYGSMYRPHKNPVFNWVQYRGRCRHHFRKPDQSDGELVIFPRKDLRTMIRLLRQGSLVWYAPDQDYGAEHSVFAPFFGVPAATITATAKLVQMGQAKVLPFTHERLPAAKGYHIVIHPPLENYPGGDEQADACRINAVIEEQVRRNPGQYLWAHRRFKTRPAGEARLY